MKPSLPKGTRDFNPLETKRRDYLFSKIEAVFIEHAFHKLETPAMEKLTTLTGKYGDEGDKLLFKILNNGDFLSKVPSKILEKKDSNSAISELSKRGLRYDLTVPFARFVSMNRSSISFPFKRYQIQPVWRADRPQKGRYQEFYQCDVDVVGSDSLIYEADFIKIYDKVFHSLGINVDIQINNRKILEGACEVYGLRDNLLEITVGIDKLDKIGESAVLEEFERLGLPKVSCKNLLSLLTKSSLIDLQFALESSAIGSEGVNELQTVFDFNDGYFQKNNISFNPLLARGLSYYTGCIFEVKALDADLGSIGGGGRYANLTEIFDFPGVSGVGISFGAERIYDAMLELDLFPDFNCAPELLIIPLDDKSLNFAYKNIEKIRNQELIVDIYPDIVKMKKSMGYANNIKVPFVGIIGESERSQNAVQLKNMATGNQKLISIADLKTNMINE